MKGLCSLCRYFQPEVGAVGNQPLSHGECRRHPPIPVLDGNGGHVANDRIWPVVDTVDWCGEFERDLDDE